MTVILCLKCAVVSAIEWKKRSQKFTFVIIAVWHVWVHFRDIALIYKWCLREGFPTVESFESSHSKCEADLRVAYGKLVIMGLCRVEVRTHLLFLVTMRAVRYHHQKFCVWPAKRSTYSENRDDQSMRQVVAYRKLKTMESWKTVSPKVVAVA